MNYSGLIRADIVSAKNNIQKIGVSILVVRTKMMIILIASAPQTYQLSLMFVVECCRVHQNSK